MSDVKESPQIRQICSTIAKQRGLDPIGGSHQTDHFLIMEGALPWSMNKFSEPGVLPVSLIDLYKKELFVSYPEQWVNATRCIIAPDKGYSVPGLRRLLYARRPTTLFSEFETQEYLVPEEEMAPLTRALVVEPEALPRFEQWRQPTNGVRDFFVCTDGLVDRACAVVGMKLYSTLRKLPEAQPGGTLRVWKTSHFGGHVYAATAITLPDGRMWGYLEGETIPALARRQGDIKALHGCYRGWMGAPSPFVNVVERELMMHYGWDWFDFEQLGNVVAEDPEPPMDEYENPEPRWGEVELQYRSPDGRIQNRATGHVDMSHRVETFYASDDPETYSYQQYTLSNLVVASDAVATAPQ